MHPALPIASQFLTEHTHRIVGILEQRQQLQYGLRLATMLREVISESTASITEKQIESILQLTKQTHEDFSKNLEHYMKEREKFSTRYFEITDPIRRLELDAHIINIDDQMKAIRRDMDSLTRFSANLIRICGESGLEFVQGLSLPYTELRRIT